MSEHARHNEIMSELLADDASREEWERTRFARAVANHVIRFRAERNLSQTALARKVGVSQPVIARLESGEHEPTVSTLRKLSQALGIRFSIDIHPIGRDISGFPDVDQGAERFVADGVEMLVLAS
jgi:transcriptional regulator with XRE-family HTH domain